MAKILIIDDDPQFSEMLSSMLRRANHEMTCAGSIREGLERIADSGAEVVFLDVRLPDGNGLDMLPRIKEASSAPEVIIITGAGDPHGAELAIKSGAWDYIEKVSPIKEIILALNRVLQYQKEKKKKSSPVVLSREEIIGSSAAITFCLNQVAEAAASDVNVLISGATGTGKEVFAKAIHRNSPRASGNFVIVDCASLPDTLAASLLLGHEKGAYTGADRQKDGLFKQADGGTIFLDEIGELSLSMQKVFLRVLQEQRFRPVGAQKEISSNFRMVAATNRNLGNLVRELQFREDLLYRLGSLTINLPSLKNRKEDIGDLILYRMAMLCKQYGTGQKGFSADFIDTLTAYDWPGNIRELNNVIESAFTAAMNESTVYSIHLPTHIRVQAARDSITRESDSVKNPDEAGPPLNTQSTLRDFRDRMEKKYLEELLAATDGNVPEACQRAGLSRSRLYALLKKHRLS